MKFIALALLEAHLVFGNEPAKLSPPQRAAEFALAPTVEDSRAYILRTSSARYSFTAPQGWSARASEAAREVVLIAPDGSRIEMRFRSDRSSRTDSADQWREQLRVAHENAEVVDQPELHALSRKAVALDLEWLQGGLSPQSGRFALIPLEHGSIEISLLTPREHFGEKLPALMQLMLSLRTGPANEPIAVRPNRPE